MGLQPVSSPSTLIPGVLINSPGTQSGLCVSVWFICPMIEAREDTRSFSSQPSGILGGKGSGLGLPPLGTTESKEEALARAPGFQRSEAQLGPTHYYRHHIFSISFFLPFLHLLWRIFSSPEEETNTSPWYFSQIICLYSEILHCLKGVIFYQKVSRIWVFLVLFSSVFCHVTSFPLDTEQKATS